MQRTAIFLAAILAAVCGRSVQNHAADNVIKKEVPPKQPVVRRFVSLTHRPPANVSSAPGQDVVELTCEAVGAPAPTVHWYMNDVPIYEHDTKPSEVPQPSPWSLGRVTAKLLVARAHRDRFTCVAVAGVKVTRATTLVYTKHGKSSTEVSKLGGPMAPRILVTYKMYVDVFGSTVELPCKAHGHPRPRITWTDNYGLPIKSDNARMKVFRSGELIISDLQWSDMGEYTCKASNAHGSQAVKTFVYPAKAA